MDYKSIDAAFEYQEADGEAALSADGTHFVQGFAVREYDVAQARTHALERINTAYTQAVAPAKAGTPEDEIATWDIQKVEAEAWQQDPARSTPGVDRIAAGRGMDRVVLLEKILAKVMAYREYVFFATGVRQGFEDALHAAQTLDEVRALSWPITLSGGDV